MQVGSLEIQLLANMARLQSDMEKAQRTVSGAVGKINNILGAIGAGISVDFLLGLAKKSNEYTKSLAALSTQISGATDQIKELDAASRKLSVQFGTDALKQSTAFYEILSAGITDTTQATALLTEANRLAIGGNADLMISVDGLTSIIKGYGDAAGTASEIADTMFTASLAGKLSIQELSENIGKVIPLATTMGVSLEEVTAGISALTLGGISAKESITGMRAILATVAKPSAEAARLAKDIGLEFNTAGIQAMGFAGFLEEVKTKTQGSADKMAILFGGVESLIPALALTGNAGVEFNNIMGQMANKAGAAENAFNKMAASPGFQWDKFMSTMSNIGITLGDVLANVLTPAAEMASKALNKLFGFNDVTGIEKQVQLVNQLTDKVESMSNRQNVPLIGGLLFDKKEFDLLEHQLEMAKADLGDMQKAQQMATAVQKQSTVEIAKNTIELGKNNENKEKAVQLSTRLEKAFNVELYKLRQYEDDAKKARDITDSVATEQERYNKKLDELNRLKPDLSVQTYERALAKLNDTTKQTAVVTQQTTEQVSQQWIQAGRNIQTALANSIFDYFNSGLDSMVQNVKTAVLRILSEFAALKISQYLGFASYFGGSGGTGVGGLLSTGGSLASLFGGGGSVGGAGGLSALSMAQLGSNATGLLRTGFGATGLTAGAVEAIGSYYGSAYLSAFGAGMNGVGTAGAASGIFSNVGGAGTAFIGGPGTALGGTGMGTAASMGATFGTGIATAGAAALGVTLGSLIAGDKRIMGMSGATTSSIGAALGGAAGVAVGAGGGVAAGAAAGSVVPVIGTIIGAIIGGIVAAGFGHGPYKFRQQSLQGEVSREGIDGSLTNVFRAKGGWFVGNKHKSFDTDIPNKLDSLIDKTISGYYKSAHKFAENLGFSTDLVDNYTQQIQIKSEKGKQITEEQVKTIFDQLANNIATNVIPTIDQYSLIGEKAGDTFARLNTEFVSLTSGVQNLGASVAYSKELIRAMDINDRTELIDSAGGIERVSQLTSAFFDGFLSNSEKLSVRTDQLNTALSALNISTDVSVDQFKALIQSTDTANDLRIALLDLAPALLAVRDAAEQAKDAANQNTLKLAQEFAPQLVIGLQRDMANEVLGKFGVTVDTSREKVTELLTAFVKSGGLFSNMADDVMEAAAAWTGFQQLLPAKTPAATDTPTKEVIDPMKQLASAYSALQRSVDAERKKITDKYNIELGEVNTSIDNLTSSVGKLKSLSDSLKNAVDQIQPLTRGQAKFELLSAINNAKRGIFPEANDLQKVLNVLSDSNSITDAKSSFEFAREQAKTSLLIQDLGNLTDTQLSIEDQSLAALKSQQSALKIGFDNQMLRLDSMLTKAQEQIDKLSGIDTRILSLSQALANFSKAYSAASAPPMQEVVTPPPSAGNPNITNKAIVDFARAPGRTEMEIYNKAKEVGVSFEQYAKATGANVQDLYDWAKKKGLPTFASGGYHKGGLRIVGEKGPELERTGPSHITSNKDMKKAIGNDEVVSKLDQLIKLFEPVIQGGTSIRTKSA